MIKSVRKNKQRQKTIKNTSSPTQRVTTAQIKEKLEQHKQKWTQKQPDESVKKTNREDEMLTYPIKTKRNNTHMTKHPQKGRQIHNIDNDTWRIAKLPTKERQQLPEKTRNPKPEN